MAARVEKMSIERFLALPEEKPGLEYENGRITQKVSSQAQHSRLQLGLGALIDQFAIPKKLALTFPELRATSGEQSYVPDLSIVRWSRLKVDAIGELTNDVSELPDIAIEIVSPHQSVTALVRHCLWYIANGATVALLIDPSDRSVLSFRPNETITPLTDADRVDLDDVLPAFELTVRGVFDLLKVK